MSTNAIKRIVNKDLKEIQKMDLQKLGIHVHFNEENMLEAKAIIIGPKNTPFENGILYFSIEFPKNYPFSPPKVSYISHSRFRIHPNLYVGKSHDNFKGKVCLSIINTWSGPKWTTIMHLGSILLSIQSLLDKNPLRNEPGFEKETGIRNDTYNQVVQYDTFQNLILNNAANIHPDFLVFEGCIREHIKSEKETIQKKVADLLIKYPKEIKISLNIYNIFMVINYKKLQKKINLI